MEKRIKIMIENIIGDGSGIVYDDIGQGCGGPGFAGPDTLQDMLDTGCFDDAVKVPYDKATLKSAVWDEVAIDIDGTIWTQIEFNFSDSDDYYMIAWVWDV